MISCANNVGATAIITTMLNLVKLSLLFGAFKKHRPATGY